LSGDPDLLTGAGSMPRPEIPPETMKVIKSAGEAGSGST
jgi:hypothetical protein